jgi:photosystem II stability/assembly factor-like uncharacterized protein
MLNQKLLASLLLILFFQTTAYLQTDPYPALPWRNIGPANMMGRIAAVEALDDDYRHVLCASASGGVFLSKNAGVTWEAIFDRYGAGSIGAVAFHQPNPNIIWVGTGEAANRNSSAWGDGIYVSHDGGKNFVNMGLENTHQIAEIATHPTDSNIVYVAAVGHLWGYSGDRGLYKTIDGGKTWEKLNNGLPNDGKTGCTEIIMHPDNPNILFAGFYQRLRKPYHYQSGGPNGGLFKSTDGGKTWRKISRGLAGGDTGMIDVAIHKSNPDIMVMAYETDEKSTDTLANTGVYRSDDGGETWQFLLKHAVRPFYHGQIDIDPIDPNNIYVVSRGAMNSTDGGRTFKRRRWRADGGDDHDMWISPKDNNIIYLATDQGLRLSTDRGKTFLSFNNMAIGQYYAIGVDMRDPYWVIGGLQDNGIWMGPSNSREWRGILNEHNTWVGEGDGFHAQIDPTDYRTLYYVNHVGFAVRTNFHTREYHYITPTPETITNFKEYADPNYAETHIKYTIDPGEHWFFYEYAERPKLPAQFRFNWSSPLVLSKKNPRTLYFGGNHLFKSIDRGNSWRIISPDLTKNDPARRNPTNSGYLTRSVTGGENHFTIISIAESPIDESVLWVGTDDGNVQVSQNGGIIWTNVKPNIPGVPDEIWVSRVEASHHELGTCYVTLDNHRYDDNQPYVFKTTDFGKTWTNISADLPKKYSVYVIKEDPINPNLLFVGTEAAIHVSLDGGKHWERLMQDMPTVAIHDLVIHPREGDLIVGTHGRSIWICDDISPLRQMTEAVKNAQLHIFDNKKATKWRRINTGRKQPFFEFRGKNPSYGASINFYINNAAAKDSALIAIIDTKTDRQSKWQVPVHKGINRSHWNFQFPSTEKARIAYQTHLKGVIAELEKVVEKPALIDSLAMIKKDLKTATSDRKLNKVRRKLVTDFAVYTPGRPFFGKKIGATTANAGTYKVEITYKGMTETGWIEVREDPLVRDW